MNKLPLATRVQILSLLCEGSSMRSISRVCDVSINTVAKLLAEAGTVCARLHDEKVRGVTAKRVQVDEIWTFTAAKERNVPTMKKPVEGAGDTWTWTGIDADTKLIIGWLVGSRDGDHANAFIADLASRLANRVQLTSDGFKPYLEAVEGVFGGEIDYAQLVKIYGPVKSGEAAAATALHPLLAVRFGRSAAARTRSTSRRLTPSGRTSPCACTCAGSRD